MHTLPERKVETGDDKFHNLISQAPVLIATFKGPNFIVEAVNKMALEIWEKSYEEVINKPLFESLPELEDGLKSILSSILLTGKPFISNEMPVQLKRLGKSDMAYFNSVYQPLSDVDNNIYGIILIGTEVTETVNARKTIETNELLTRTILESSPDCLKVLDLEGRIQYMNYSGLCQMEIDDFSNFENKNWYTLWNIETQSLVKASIDKAAKGETTHFTAFCPTAKGTPKWWDVMVSPVRKPGEEVQKIISVSRDITEQIKSQETLNKMAWHLKLATDSANVGVWSLNIQTQELEWTALHKKMWGYDEYRTDLTYEDWHTLIVPEDKELAFKRAEEARVNHTLYEVEYRIKKINDNVIRFIRSVGTYYYNDKGEAETLTGISLDITEQKLTEAKIQHLNIVLEEKVKSRTEELHEKNIELKRLSANLQRIREDERKYLAREVHDELGQLATALKIDVDWLSLKVEGLEAAAKNRIAHANKIIELMITDIRKIATGLRPSVLDDFGLNTALQWHCAEFQNLNGIPCIFEPGVDDKDMSMNTKTELFRIAQESLTNILRHAKASSISISTKEDAENLYLIITDNGIGFDSSKLKASLGLIGLRERAATLHGKLQIESSIGKGTIITVYVPKK